MKEERKEREKKKKSYIYTAKSCLKLLANTYKIYNANIITKIVELIINTQ